MRKRNSTMTCNVLVATYSRPGALAWCLTSLFDQSRLPDETIVCDDGSGPATHQLLLQLQAHSPAPFVHVWQPDEGFKLAQIRNEGIGRATSRYLVKLTAT